MTEVAIQDPVAVMAPFARVIGGKWYVEQPDAPLSYHIYEWGVNQQTVITRSYFPGQNGDNLVSEGRWFWHPGEEIVKGYSVAINMPVTFFDYTVTSFADEKLTMELTSYSPTGDIAHHIETWAFTDDDHYVFTLHTETPDGLVKTLEFPYKREQ